jgi:hypothetical protein
VSLIGSLTCGAQVCVSIGVNEVGACFIVGAGVLPCSVRILSAKTCFSSTVIQALCFNIAALCASVNLSAIIICYILLLVYNII